MLDVDLPEDAPLENGRGDNIEPSEVYSWATWLHPIWYLLFTDFLISMVVAFSGWEFIVSDVKQVHLQNYLNV